MKKPDPTILYVEDDLDFAELNIRWFENRGYRMIHARDGAQAVKAMTKKTPDIVLLDVMLPDRTGFEVCAEIQKHNSTVPVIFLTSLSDSQHAIRGLESGAYDYIRKDTELPEIETRIKAILARTARTDIVRITDDCYIDHSLLSIVVRGKAHKVSLRTIRLLLLLFQQQGTIVKRDFLMQQIWKDENINAGAYLNQSMTELRCILSADKRIKLKSHRYVGVVLSIREA